MKRKIGIVTVARSDYGVYLPILRKIVAHNNLELLLYVSGAHLVEKFGNTIKAIEEDGFPIAAKIPMISKGDTPFDIARSMGVGTQNFAQVFRDHAPDILVVLGDRYEMHAAAVAAIPYRIPIAHIHGGELTYGAFDDYFRHSLTKFSHLHFASSEIYAHRIKQMGEESWRVTVSGAPGLDDIMHAPRLSKSELATTYGIDLAKPTLLVTFHPVTMEYEYTEKYITNLLNALAHFSEYHVVFTYPNEDAGSAIIIEKIESYARNHPNAYIVKNFGHKGYISMMGHAAAMVGNSSSGIVEAASLKLPVVNIGTREEGRVRNANVIDVGYAVEEIKTGILKALSKSFCSSLQNLVNCYGDGKASERIVAVLAKVTLAELLPKRFHDISLSSSSHA